MGERRRSLAECCILYGMFERLDYDKVSMNLGFYYMANAGGRLAGTVLSGWVYQSHGLTGCLWWSTAFVLAAALLSFQLPEVSGAGHAKAPASRG